MLGAFRVGGFKTASCNKVVPDPSKAGSDRLWAWNEDLQRRPGETAVGKVSVLALFTAQVQCPSACSVVTIRLLLAMSSCGNSHLLLLTWA